MSKVEEKAQALSQMVGTIVKETLGKDANFIFIPFITKEGESEAAVISNLKGGELSFHLGMIAAKTIDKYEPENQCQCEKCKAKRNQKQTYDDLNVTKIH